MPRMRFIMVLILACLASQARAQSPVDIGSPDGRVRIGFTLEKAGETESVPHYSVSYDGKSVVPASRLGVNLGDGTALGGACEIVKGEISKVHEEYVQVSGKRRDVVADATQMVVTLKEKAAPGRVWEVIFRAYNDGAAFRYHFPKQEGWDNLVIANERTEFRFAPETRAYALPLNGYTTSHEKRYEKKPVKDLTTNQLLGLPLLLESPGGVFVGLTEANVNEYAGMYLAPMGGGLLSAKLSPLPKEPGIAVRWSLPHASPWRAFILGDRVGALVESNLVLNLSEPLAIQDPSWIKTGKTTFPWWNDFAEEGVDFKPGLNTETANYYIDFCAKAGIPYHSLDGVNNVAWYGGPIVPYEGADPSKGLPGLDLPAVLKHAKEKGVRIRLWMHWGAADQHMEKNFPLYREWGIEGVMLDFMDRDDQEMNRFVRKAVALAAENHLTVTLHGCPQPTGLERTYPNLLTHEGVMNLEYDKWDPKGVSPDHELTVPFTRMLAGPLDFHQGSFRAVKIEAFKAKRHAPLVIGTAARTLASYVIYQNHLSMVADYPSAYKDHPGLPVLAAIPTTWDDTKVLDAKVGELAVFARRSGKDWHIGAMTDKQTRTLEVPLTFLPAGRFQAEIVDDDDQEKAGMKIQTQEVTAESKLKLKLAPAGGSYVKLSPRS